MYTDNKIRIGMNEKGENICINPSMSCRHGLIAGATGSGKTSLVNLISRLYDVSEGSLLVGGVDVRNYDLVTLRDEAGKSIRSVELFGDKVDRPVDFADGGKVADFAGRPVVVEFEMFDADLYSFRFHDRLPNQTEGK